MLPQSLPLHQENYDMPLLNSKLVATFAIVTAASLFLWIIPSLFLAVMAIFAGITFVFGVILLAFDAVLLYVIVLLAGYARRLLRLSSIVEKRESGGRRFLGSFSERTRNVLMVVVAIVGGSALLKGLQLLSVQGFYPLTPLIYPMMKIAWFQISALCAILLDAFARSKTSYQA